jgi:hypothetical protein
MQGQYYGFNGLLEEVSAGSGAGRVLEEVSAESGAGGLPKDVSVEFGAGCSARGAFCDGDLRTRATLLVGIEAADVSIPSVSVVFSVFFAHAVEAKSSASAKHVAFTTTRLAAPRNNSSDPADRIAAAA